MPELVEAVFSFGTWVRRRRKALDLTQASLADQVCCAEITIRKLESDAFRPSPEVAYRLARCLQIPDELVEEFVRVARAERAVDRLPEPLTAIALDRHSAGPATLEDDRDAGKPKAAGRRAHPDRLPALHTLPAQATPLVGREREIAEVCSLLGQPTVRLLTLTGPGGIGKTRLSLAVGAEVASQFEHGVCFVPLAALVDPLLVPATIAQVLGVQEMAGTLLVEGIKSFVRNRKMLLILDNFEQVLPA
ncbi:MAG: helix-turn-helix domain-containing protein, partial [Chloroflexi bacterium]|nr:helix-turn-helix domain-containing protein [Chloroflexota bacterium]